MVRQTSHSVFATHRNVARRASARVCVTSNKTNSLYRYRLQSSLEDRMLLVLFVLWLMSLQPAPFSFLETINKGHTRPGTCVSTGPINLRTRQFQKEWVSMLDVCVFVKAVKISNFLMTFFKSSPIDKYTTNSKHIPQRLLSSSRTYQFKTKPGQYLSINKHARTQNWKTQRHFAR